ncbi:hypothetical protein TIFTF001_042012 [Ficus carica]|uniref:Uncharacterized protein n=1 Tax=Ficus carica TaxID=3494 RepID=A0AA88DD33_FICCA|nr:hypothetical protein TIFTF001_042012 [Ficus carica]
MCLLSPSLKDPRVVQSLQEKPRIRYFFKRRDDAVAGVQAEAKYLLAWEASDSIIFLQRKPCFLHYQLLILQEKIVDLNGPFLFKVSLPYYACPSL